MAKYHINPETGNPGICTAEKRCRYGEVEHFRTEEEARSEFERQMDLELKQLETADIINNMPLKEMDAALLATTLYKEAQKNDMDATYIATSMDVASILHARQMRSHRANFPKTPYIEHPLRNAIRLMRLGVRNENIIVAAVLHDAIEDGSDIFVEKYLRRTPSTEEQNRQKLTAFIRQRYGEETAEIVLSVTNPVKEPGTKMEHGEYRAHVLEQIERNPGAYLVKLSDLFDNAGSLYHQDLPGNEAHVKKLANKYLPLVDQFMKLGPTSYHLIDPAGAAKIEKDLKLLKTRLTSLVEKYGRTD